MFLRQLRLSLRACGHATTQTRSLGLAPRIPTPSIAYTTPVHGIPKTQSRRRKAEKQDTESEHNRKIRRARTTICVHGLPEGTTVDDLRSAFERFGPIQTILTSEDVRGPSKLETDQAYIAFRLADDATKAFDFCKLEGLAVNSTKVEAEWFNRSLDTMMLSPTIQVTKLREGTELSAIQELFSQYAEVENIRFGAHPGTAYIDFRSAEDASSVMDAHLALPIGFDDDRALGLQFAAPSISRSKYARPAAATAELHAPHRKVFVTKFGKPVSEELLRRVFGSYGEVTSVVINYYTDGPSRNLAFIEFATVEEACVAIEAWKNGELVSLGPQLRMNFYQPPVENPPHHTLRIEGYSGGKKMTEKIAAQFSPFLWRTTYSLNTMRQGKGSTVAFLEFDTTYHATKALEQLRTMKVNGDEEVVASYAPQPKSWQTVGGVQGRDFGGEEFAYGLATGGSTARLHGETQLFRDVRRRDLWGRLERIAKYIGQDWKPSNTPQVKSLVQQLAERRTEAPTPAQTNAINEQVGPEVWYPRKSTDAS